MDVQHSNVRFLGSLVLNLWDCGGQHVFYENYFTSKRDHIFSDVAVLIYVFDVNSEDIASDLRYYSSAMEALSQYSADAKVFVLIHKMDLIPEEVRARVFEERAALIAESSWGFAISTFKTSIWDETLYKAWSSIVYSLIPNIRVLEDNLAEFAATCGADEVVLFEKATFLVISHATRAAHSDVHRFEKVSNIVKQFKLSCIKAKSQLKGMRAGNSTFTTFIDAFTSNTYIMVVSSDRAIPDEATLLNVSIAKLHFERLISEI